MKHAVLKSVAHNFVDSYGNGVGFMIGYHEMFVYEEASRSDDGYIEIDFLSGNLISGGPISNSLQTATELYRDKLPNLCTKHDATVDDFKLFTAKFWNEYDGRHCAITVKDTNGKTTTTEFTGDPPKKRRVLDESGRVRTKD